MKGNMKNIKLVIEYNGAGYAGWQLQPNVSTVQGEIEQAINKLTSQDVAINAAGRTDSGVHAIGQVANFRIDHNLEIQKYRDALNYYLPNDILVRSAEEVPFDFHARFDAMFRRYQYLIGIEKSALYRDMRWEIKCRPDEVLLTKAADYIKGEHDFSTFCVISSQKDNNNCLIFQSEWTRQGNALKYEITADRFLHTMIRSLMGLMIELGCGWISWKHFIEIFNSGDHTAIPKVAPPHGLCLVGVEY